MSATMKAAAHLGQYYPENLRTTKNTDFEKVKQMFDISVVRQVTEIDPESQQRNIWNIHNRMEYNCSQAVESKGTRLL